MKDVRFLHTATLLDDGMVLLTGGSLLTARGEFFPESSAELFDPASGSSGHFLAAADMLQARVLHSATLLVSGPHAGEVLIVGGQQIDRTLKSAELFQPPHR